MNSQLIGLSFIALWRLAPDLKNLFYEGLSFPFLSFGEDSPCFRVFQVLQGFPEFSRGILYRLLKRFFMEDPLNSLNPARSDKSLTIQILGIAAVNEPNPVTLEN